MNDLIQVTHEHQNSTRIRDLIAEKLKKIIKKPCERILFINPMHIAEQDFMIDRAKRKRYWIYPPYSCGVLCRRLEERGYKTDIIDLNFEVLRAANVFDNFDYRIWIQLLQEKLNQFKPDLIGLSCMFSMSHSIVQEIAHEIRTHDPQLPIIIGGVHASNASHLVLKDWPDIDFLSYGESDSSFPDMLDFINGNLTIDYLRQVGTVIEGTYYGKHPHTTSDDGNNSQFSKDCFIDTHSAIDRPQFSEVDGRPLYHSLPIVDYESYGQIGSYRIFRKSKEGKATSVRAGAGCRYQCSFCTVPQLNGVGVRSRNVEDILDEIQEFYEQGGRHITWLDDDLLAIKGRAEAIFRGILERNLDITWDASNGLVAASITPQIMKAMAESGCVGFNLGIESGTPEILKSVHKPGTLDGFRKAKQLTDLYPHIFVKGFIILGFVGETIGQILNTVNFCMELNLDWYALQTLNLLPSTEIYKTLLKQGEIEDRINISEVAYVFGPSGRLLAREKLEKKSAKPFYNPFTDCDLNSPPKDQQELDNLSVIVDYYINYYRILKIAPSQVIKLQKAKTILQDICFRIAPDSPSAHLYLGIVHEKLNEHTEAKSQARIVREMIYGSETEGGSAFWKQIFEVLKIDQLIDSIS